MADARASEQGFGRPTPQFGTQPSANRAASLLRMAAMTLGRSGTALGAFYRRLAARVGKAKAITVTARTLAIRVYRTLTGDFSYADPGAEAYDAHHRALLLTRLRHRAKKLGFALVDLESGELLETVVSLEYRSPVHSAGPS